MTFYCLLRFISAKTRNMDMVRLYSMQEFTNLPFTSWNIKQPMDENKAREEALSTGKNANHHQ